VVWTTWRQHRAALLVGVLLLSALAVTLIVSGLALRSEYQADGVADCVADPAGSDGCAAIVEQFGNRHAEWGKRLMWVILLPGLVGVFVGAPLLAREFEYGTWRLAFTQSVSRTRWLMTKLGMVGAGSAVLAGAFAALFTWWRAPIDAVGSRLQSSAFTVAPPSLIAVTVFALAVGVFAGALLRRTIAAMGVTLAVYLVVRIPIEEFVRRHYLSPQVRITEPPRTESAAAWRPERNWIVEDGWIDRSGRLLSDDEKATVIRKVYDGARADGGGQALERYLSEHGLRHYVEYQPSGTFMTMQLIEAAVFLCAAAVLLGMTVWLVRRRTS
jgi:hypothetical protein